MRPINKLAALGATGGGPSFDREQRSNPVAFGKPTAHLTQPVTIERKTTHRYIHAKLTEEEADRLFQRILEATTCREGQQRYLKPGAGAQARALIIDELETILGPHQIASPAKHPPFQKVLDRVLDQLRWLPAAAQSDDPGVHDA